MKDRVAILAREKSECMALLEDLRNSGVSRREVFLCWEDIWLSEQQNEYDFILIDYCFFDMFRNDIVCYHLFHRYKFKITFYSNISQTIKTQNGGMTVDLYRIFFRPYVDFDNLIESNKNNDIQIGTQDTVVGIDFEKKYGLDTDVFFLKEGYSLIKFHLSEVLCFESDRNYVTVYLNSGKHLIRQTLQSTLKGLPNKFYRINRSVIININKVDKLVGNRVYIQGLNKFRPVISNKYKRGILDAVPLFNETSE